MRELRIEGSLCFASLAITYDLLNHLMARLQRTSIATREYPCYAFVLCYLMVVPCVGNESKQQVILKTELTAVKNDHF